jgi:hypothetical protein
MIACVSSPYVFGLTVSVNPNTAETSTGFPCSTGVSLTAFQFNENFSARRVELNDEALGVLRLRFANTA